MSNIFYICDRKKPCSFSPKYGKDCKHTTNPEHALNGISEDPEHDKRFIFNKEFGDFWEIEEKE